ncbi:DDB1- and CUL4-associated factor 15, partial [Geodia barretti]
LLSSSCTEYHINGWLATGSKHFGLSSERGYILEPRPAANITARQFCIVTSHLAPRTSPVRTRTLTLALTHCCGWSSGPLMLDSVLQYNVVKLLQRRQIFQYSSACAIRRRITATLPVQKIQLVDIGNQRLLLDGHVLLGFSRCGRLLLSYCNELDVTATQSTYTIYCWLFQGRSPLKYVCQEPLFRGETVPADLHLLVCQTPPPTHTIVVGCSRPSRRTSAEDFCRPCYISILPSFPPSTLSTPYSLHLKFDLMPPFPSFIPSLSLRVESKLHSNTVLNSLADCVVINSGDSVVALHYLLPSEPSDSRRLCATRLRLQLASSSGPL